MLLIYNPPQLTKTMLAYQLRQLLGVEVLEDATVFSPNSVGITSDPLTADRIEKAGAVRFNPLKHKGLTEFVLRALPNLSIVPDLAEVEALMWRPRKQ